MSASRKRTAEDDLRARVQRLGLWGVLAHWEETSRAPWLPELVTHEEEERRRRSLERRVRQAKLRQFKPMCDFDWSWPEQIDRDLVSDILTLKFLEDAANIVLVGPNGVGKTMIAKNIAHEAVLRGHTARFITASELLNDLAAQESSAALTRRLRHYCHPTLLVIDEVGYLSTSSDHADLLFEVVTRRYQEKPIVLTTNKPFNEWSEVFPSATIVVTLVDRLIHRSEVVTIDARSYRLKEAKEREKVRRSARAAVQKRRRKK